MGRRFLSRKANGKFRHATLENTFGLHAPVCPNPDCRSFNPHGVNEPRPETCHRCGARLDGGEQERK